MQPPSDAPMEKDRHDEKKSAADRPVVSIRDFPRLQTPYAIALQMESPQGIDDIHIHPKSSSSEIPLPPVWKSFIHPKGWFYYYHPVHRLVTDYRIETHAGIQELEAAIVKIEGFPINRLPKGCELLIDHQLEARGDVPEKHFVDHERRRITSELPGQRSASLSDDGTWKDDDIDVRRQLLYEEAYWGYIKDHPCHAELPKNAEDDAIAALTWYTQDRLLNPEDSITPFSREMSQDLLDVLSRMSENKATFDSPRNGYYKTYLVASILERVAGERLGQHYGHPDARNYLKKAVRLRREYPEEPQSFPLGIIFTFTMSVLCFGTPYAYQNHINDFFVRGVGRTETITERWQTFVEENVADWTNTNLVATVLVSASVALLAIPGIDKITRIIGITSTLFSIASIIVGLLNVWQHQHTSRNNLELTVIFDFFDKAERFVKTDKLLAILLSLPMVLLIWSSVMFAVSMVTFAWFGVDDTAIQAGSGGGGSGDATQEDDFKFGLATAWIATGCLSFLTGVVLSSFVYFWRVWKPSSYRKAANKEKAKVKQRTWDFLHQRRSTMTH